jgi:Outer membrane protein beta-barrel domain
MNIRTAFYPFFLTMIFIVTGFAVSAQVRPGIKFGISSPDVSPKDFIVTDQLGEDYYKVFVEEARYGVHAGAFIQFQMGGFFIQPEVLYNSSSVDYRIDSLFAPGSRSNYFRDTYRNIDFPIMLGLKSGPVRLGGGPVGHLQLDSSSGFSEYDNFEAFTDDLTWGWQAGVGLDFWKLHIDVRYEGNFSELGDHITFFGKKFDFATNNNRLIASLGFSF